MMSDTTKSTVIWAIGHSL